ncbi:MAG: ABC transporter ATP-binding protein [Anaerolineae bacterium]|nr:ABC transporter ATP-binding protein [Anaerolineae bacterium]
MLPLIEMRSVSKIYDQGGLFTRKQSIALKDVSLTIADDRPTVIAIAGESGSGKTTLARMLLGFTQPSVGDIRYRGKSLREMSGAESKTFRREVQAIFQDPFEVYNPFYKVDHILTTPIRKFGLAASKADAHRLIVESLEKVGLRPEDTLGRYPHQLSGGQRQRIMIARALLLNPRILVADEPVSMVDASLRATILEGLLRLNREMGISLVYITHDLTTAYQVSDAIMILYRGTVAEVGDVEQVIKQPQHPYTQLLVSAIPQPDPDHRWEPETTRADTEEASAVLTGCPFVDRCPVVIGDICRQAPPPLFQTDPRRAAACYHYKSAPATQSDVVLAAPTQRELQPERPA